MSFRLPEGVRPYFERAPLAALFLGVSSGFTFAMIGATLTTRLAQHGITKSAVTAFALTFLAYNWTGFYVGIQGGSPSSPTTSSSCGHRWSTTSACR